MSFLGIAERVRVGDRWQRLRQRSGGLLEWIPYIQLTDEAFAARYRVLRVVLWLHIPLVVIVATATTFSSSRSMGSGQMSMGSGDPSLHLIFTWSFVAGSILAGALVPLMRTNRAKALMVAAGLLMC